MIAVLTRAQEDALRDLLREADRGEVQTIRALIRRVAKNGPHAQADVIAAFNWWRRPLNWS